MDFLTFTRRHIEALRREADVLDRLIADYYREAGVTEQQQSIIEAQRKQARAAYVMRRVREIPSLRFTVSGGDLLLRAQNAQREAFQTIERLRAEGGNASLADARAFPAVVPVDRDADY